MEGVGQRQPQPGWPRAPAGRPLPALCTARRGCGGNAGDSGSENKAVPRSWAREGAQYTPGLQPPVPPFPGLTCAAARTFWYKLFPWSGSGGPANTAGGAQGRAGTPHPGQSPHPGAPRTRRFLDAGGAAAQQLQEGRGAACAQVQQQLQHLRAAGHPPGHPPGHLPAARTLDLAGQPLTLSFTWPEPPCSRARRYSRRHWLLPADS